MLNIFKLAVAANFILAANMSGSAIAQDTAACNQYYQYAATAGGDPRDVDPSTGRIGGRLKTLYDACLASRRGNTGNVENQHCNCPVGSRCVDGGNRCVPLGNASDECRSGYVKDWDGSCIPRSRAGRSRE